MKIRHPEDPKASFTFNDIENKADKNGVITMDDDSEALEAAFSHGFILTASDANGNMVKQPIIPLTLEERAAIEAAAIKNAQDIAQAQSEAELAAAAEAELVRLAEEETAKLAAAANPPEAAPETQTEV